MMLSLSTSYYQILLSHGFGFGVGAAFQCVKVSILSISPFIEGPQVLPSCKIHTLPNLRGSDILLIADHTCPLVQEQACVSNGHREYLALSHSPGVPFD